MTEPEIKTIAERYCSGAEHCCTEVRAMLERRNVESADIDRVINHLVKEGYIDEARYARALVHDKVRFAKWGRKKIAQALWQKRIPKDVATDALQTIDEDEYMTSLRDVVKSRYRVTKGATEYERKMKTMKTVCGRGFEPALVSKMLELSDMSSQTVLEKKNEVSAQDIARQAVQASGIEQAPHVAFSLQLGQGTDTRFKTHRRSAVRILELLLDNAMKFTHQAESYHAMLEEGKRERVTLTVSYEDSHARFVVEDTGIGIPAKEAERIFDEFVQLDDYYDGTGIGLTVARSLARRLGGDVLLDTSYTDGARFVMTL